jgi:hypothetical protein
MIVLGNFSLHLPLQMGMSEGTSHVSRKLSCDINKDMCMEITVALTNTQDKEKDRKKESFHIPEPATLKDAHIPGRGKSILLHNFIFHQSE